MERKRKRQRRTEHTSLLERLLGRTGEEHLLNGQEARQDQGSDPRLAQLQERLDTMRGQVETILISIEQPHGL